MTNEKDFQMNIKTSISKTLLPSFISILLSLTSLNAIAKDVWCNGAIINVWVQSDGSAFIHGDWRGAHTMICSVNASWKGVSSEVCKTWLGIAQQAHATQKPVIVRYSNVSSCKSIPHYGNAPSPEYIMLR